MAAYVLDEDGQGISIRGWRVRATKGPIIGDGQIEACSKQLGGVLTVPEILFGNSNLQLTHQASGTTLSFEAVDALRAWRQEDLPPLKVTMAQQWQAARREEIQRQQAVVIEYDWTYTTPYQGTVSVTSDAPLQEAAAAAADPQQQQQQHAQQDGQQHAEEPAQPSCSAENAGGRPVTRRICTSLQGQPQSPAAAAQAHAAAAAAAAAEQHSSHQQHLGASSTTQPSAAAKAAAAAAPRAPTEDGLPIWQPTSKQANRALLLSRDEPILFFAEVPLYESELDDNGCSQLVAKVRVMPRCWLVLLRFWLRVDGTLVRLRETRLFCR